MNHVMVPFVSSTVGTYVYYRMQAPPDMGSGDAPTHMVKGTDGVIYNDRFGDYLTAYDVHSGEHVSSTRKPHAIYWEQRIMDYRGMF